MTSLLLEGADVILVSVYYLAFGFLASLLVNHVIEIFDEDMDKYATFPTWRLGLEVGAHVVVLAVVFYLLRLLIRRIPFPWDGRSHGYDHSTLYEIDGGIVLVVVILFFQRRLIEKVGVFQNRVREALGYNDVPDQ